MSKKNNSLIFVISALSIRSSKGRSQDISQMDKMLMLHSICLANSKFDSTLPVDDTLTDEGKIPPKLLPIKGEDDEEYDEDFHSEGSDEIQEEIDEEVYDPNSDWDLNPSEVGHVPLEEDDGPQAWVPYQFSNSKVSEAAQAAQDDECHQIVIAANKHLTDLGTLAESMMTIVIAFSRILGTVAKSGNFELVVVKSFLEEFVILLGTMFTIDIANDLPESWNFFKELAKLQCELFEIYLDAETYQHRQELIWMLSDNTDFQKKFLQRCIDESMGYEHVMSEVGAAIDSMLSLQDEFILKLIANLQKSKAVQVSNLPNSMEC
jgi:hypothetical protein